MTGRLADRIAVVTGASRGIGYATAKALAAEGAHIVAIARTTGGLEELDDEIRQGGGSATLVPLDLKDFDAIDRLGASLFERWGKLDILVGNAAVLGVLSPVGHLDPKVWDNVFAVNVTANWRLLRSLDPLLQKSDAGRAVFVTSGSARSCRAFWSVYAASKAALDALVRSYAAENEATSVCANLFDPDIVRTAMRAQAMPGEDPTTLPTPKEVAAKMVYLTTPDCTENGQRYDAETGRFEAP